MLHVVLFEPEIPQNTGNIARTCVGFNCILHLIKPYGFILNDKLMVRSGVDYWKHLKLIEHNTYDEFLESLPKNSIIYYVTRYGQLTPNKIKSTNIEKKDIYIMFGKESTGIPKNILKTNLNKTIRIPSSNNVRSLNLSNCVAILVYRVCEKNKFKKLEKLEPHKRGFLLK